MFGLHTSCQVILGLVLYTSTSSSHTLGRKSADLLPAFAFLHNSVCARDANQNGFTYNNTYAGSQVSKRGLYNLQRNSPSDANILEQAYWDMVEVVDWIAADPNTQVMARYFHPAHTANVTAIFNTVLLMAQNVGHPNPPVGPPRM